MTDEPYRWVEAIGNRREYIEAQLAPGSPVVVLRALEGILLFTVAPERQKIYEIYDRIGMGALGHPADIERLRAAALEVASAEGFLRSVQDVSTRRLVSYSLAPVVKAAFEQIFGPPYLARCMFVELGRSGQPDVGITLDYDGTFRIQTSSLERPLTAAIAGHKKGSEAMQKLLIAYEALPLREALKKAMTVWAHGAAADTETGGDGEEGLMKDVSELLERHRGGGAVEAGLLSGEDAQRVCFRRLDAEELTHL